MIKINSRLARKVMVAGTFLATAAIPAMAFAQDAAATAGGKSTMDPKVAMTRAIAAAVVMCIAAMSAGYAQGKIGSAAAGTMAERPEAGTMLMVITALTEIIVLMGFVIAFMINSNVS
jgi:V/A-type H+-transporting ATPase subunit K